MMDVVKILKIISDINYALDEKFILNFFTEDQGSNEISVRLSSQDSSVNVTWNNILTLPVLSENVIIAELLQHVQDILNKHKDKVTFYTNVLESAKKH